MITTGLRRTLRTLLVDGIRRLPDGVVLAILQGVGLRRKLDYSGADLFLNVASPEEYFIRLRSCAKEPETVQWLEEVSQEGDAVYDIGANVGAYSLVAAKGGKGVRRVYAFEPGFANYGQLCRNILLNGCDREVVPLPIALSDRTELAEFRLSNLSPGAASQVLHENGGAGSAGAGTGSVQRVMTWGLDDLIRTFGFEPPNLMKIDVDGAEIKVLDGARETLREEALRSVLVEAGPETRDAVFERLESAGLSLHSEHTHKAVNYIFVRRDRGT